MFSVGVCFKIPESVKFVPLKEGKKAEVSSWSLYLVRSVSLEAEGLSATPEGFESKRTLFIYKLYM